MLRQRVNKASSQSIIRLQLVKFVSLDLNLAVGHFEGLLIHLQEFGLGAACVIEGGVGDAEVAEHLLLLRLQPDLCISEDEVVLIIKIGDWNPRLGTHLVHPLVSHTEDEAFSEVGSDAWVERALREAADDRAVFELDERKQVLLQVEVGVEVGSVERVESVAELGPELAANEFFKLIRKEEGFTVFHF